MNEADLEKYLRERVRRIGGMLVKMPPVVRGTTDRLVLLPGAGLHLVELKTKTGRRSASQEVFHSRAARIGVVVYTLHGAAEVDAWLRARLDASYAESKADPGQRCSHSSGRGRCRGTVVERELCVKHLGNAR